MAKTEFSRLVWKRSSTTGVVPTIPSVETISEDWLTTDLLIGEGFINTVDERVWYRAASRIVEINTQGYGETIQTTDATLTTLITVPIPTSYCMTFKIDYNAMQTDDSKGYGEQLIYTYRNDAGVLKFIGSSSIYKHNNFAFLGGAVSISGTNVLIQVKGEAATTVDWTCRYQLSFVETGLI